MMNPKTWPKEHQVALAIACVMGFCLGDLLGYTLDAISSGSEGGYSVGFWVSHPFELGGIWWALFGAAVGAGIIYIRRLTSK